VQDGMFLVGLDIVGDKILEINVFTPGGMWSMTEMYKTDFLETVIIALETKLALRDAYASSLSNLEIATL
jgi:glutathione synthase